MHFNYQKSPNHRMEMIQGKVKASHYRRGQALQASAV